MLVDDAPSAVFPTEEQLLQEQRQREARRAAAASKTVPGRWRKPLHRAQLDLDMEAFHSLSPLPEDKLKLIRELASAPDEFKPYGVRRALDPQFDDVPTEGWQVIISELKEHGNVRRGSTRRASRRTSRRSSTASALGSLVGDDDLDDDDDGDVRRVELREGGGGVQGVRLDDTWRETLRRMLSAPPAAPPAGAASRRYGPSSKISEREREELWQRMDVDATEEVLRPLRARARQVAGAGGGGGGRGAWAQRREVAERTALAHAEAQLATKRPFAEEMERELQMLSLSVRHAQSRAVSVAPQLATTAA